MIAKPEILQSVEHMIKSKIRKIFVNEKILKNIVLKFMKLIRIIMSITKKIKVDENDHNYILFSVDFNFSKCILAVEVDGKGHTDRDLIFEKKRQEALEKTLDCNFISINPSKENYDADYEIVRIQTFISKFKNKKLIELEEELKEKLNLHLTSQII